MPARPTRTIAIVTVAAVVVAGGAWGISRLVSDDDPASDAGTASSTGGGVPLDVSAGGPYRVEAGTDLLLDASIAVSGQTDVAADLAAIGAAIVAYRDDLGVYPPAYLTDADGKPTLSWRVLVLPYLGEDELYAKFDLTKAWDDPANAELVGEIPAVFRADTAGSDVASPAPGDTSYAGVSGDKHVFRAGGASPDDGLPSAAVSDGNSYTLGAGPVGAQVSIPWSSPGDIDTFEHPTLGDPAGFDGPGDLVTPLVFLDGAVHTYDDTLPQETVLSWSSIAGDTCSPPASLDVDLISAWDFDGDGTPDAFGPEVTFPGTDAGEYPVQLTVDDGFGGTHTVVTTVTVS